MLTAQQLVFGMLEYLGEFSLTLVEYTGTAATGVQRAYLSAINQGQGELFDLNPGLFKREVGLTVLGPLGGTVGVTQGSTAVTSPTFTGGPASYCDNALNVTGQTNFNALRTEGASAKLLFPFTGTTGTQTATLYGNALPLDPAWSRPLGPVWLSDLRILPPLAGKPEYLAYDPYQNLHSDWGRTPAGIRRLPRAPRIAQPEAYYCDTHTLEAGTAQVRLFLTPLPDQQYSLRFDAGVKPIDVIADDIGSDDNTDPGRAFGLPDSSLDQTFLRPLAMYHWSRSAFFKNKDARAQIAADYVAAKAKIEQWKVQIQTGSHIETRGWR